MQAIYLRYQLDGLTVSKDNNYNMNAGVNEMVRCDGRTDSRSQMYGYDGGTGVRYADITNMTTVPG
jgi:hypothetical protein